MQRCHFVVLALMCGILAGCGAASRSSSIPEVQAASSSGSSSGAGGSATPTPIATVNSFPVSGWQTCGTCGNTGGSGNAATANYSVVDTTTPSLDGDSSKFSIAALDPYANAYWWYVDSPTYASSTHVAYEFELYIPSAARDASQAVEFEFQQSSGGMTYNFAWQANFGGGYWRNFDYVSKAWVATTVSLSELTPDTWHLVRVEGTRTDSTLTNTSITIDGNTHTVNSQFAAANTGFSDKFTNAFQLDSDKNMDPYSVYVDKMKVEIY
jgi:hypothetical protein